MDFAPPTERDEMQARIEELERDLEKARAAQVEVTQSELAEQIAVGMHTGLRKGSEAPSSHKLWKAIATSDDSAWSDAAAYCVYGLTSMGYKITKEDET